MVVLAAPLQADRPLDAVDVLGLLHAPLAVPRLHQAAEVVERALLVLQRARVERDEHLVEPAVVEEEEPALVAAALRRVLPVHHHRLVGVVGELVVDDRDVPAGLGALELDEGLLDPVELGLPVAPQLVLRVHVGGGGDLLLVAVADLLAQDPQDVLGGHPELVGTHELGERLGIALEGGGRRRLRLALLFPCQRVPREGSEGKRADEGASSEAKTRTRHVSPPHDGRVVRASVA